MSRYWTEGPVFCEKCEHRDAIVRVQEPYGDEMIFAYAKCGLCGHGWVTRDDWYPTRAYSGRDPGDETE